MWVSNGLNEESDIRRAYEEWALRYDVDSKRGPAIVMEAGKLVRLLSPNKNDVILEIGCGTGRVTRQLARKCRKVVGIDFSQAMLDVARRKSKSYENIDYRIIDLRQIPFPFKNSCFDKVVCPLVIDHVEDTESLFHEIFRILKGGGILVFDDIIPDGNIAPSFRDVIYEKSQIGEKIFYHHSIDSFVHNLHRAGFKIEEMKFSRVDETIRGTITRDSFQKNKGRTFGIFVKARKG